MKFIYLIMMLPFMFSASCGAVPAVPSGQGADDDKLSWLMGCWQTEDGGTTERWQAGSATHYFGSSVTVQDGLTVFFEQMRLETGPEGLTFYAYPNGEGPSAFAQTHHEKTSFTVENTAHDYPQKITYAAHNQRLLASISRSDGRDVNRWDYVRCQN